MKWISSALAFVVAVIFSTPLFSETAFEPLLVPVFFGEELHGAAGSTWDSEFVAYNNAHSSILIFGVGCPLGITCPEFGVIPPQMVYHPSIYPSQSGYLLWVDSSRDEDVAWDLRVSERFPLTMRTGVSIPVAREGAFRRGKFSLANVHVASRTRYLLRIYLLPPFESPGNVSVEVRDTRGSLVASRPVSLSVPGRQPFEFPVYPGYAEADLSDVFSGLDEAARTSITVGAENHASVLWGLLTLTDNVTQQVTTYTPQ